MQGRRWKKSILMNGMVSLLSLEMGWYLRWVSFHSFIHYIHLYSTSSRLLLRSAPYPFMADRNSFEARMCQNGPLWCQLKLVLYHREGMVLPCRSIDKRTRSTSFPCSRGCCDLWYPGWDNRVCTGNQSQGPANTTILEQQYLLHNVLS